MSLAAAVGQLQLPDGLIVLARQPQDDIPHKPPQVICGKGEREKLLRLLVYRPLPTLHQDLVKVCGKHVKRQLPGPQILTELDRLVPRRPGKFGHFQLSSLLSTVADAAENQPPKVVRSFTKALSHTFSG
jgi:hypothetical protein